MDAYVFEAELAEYPEVTRRLALRGEERRPPGDERYPAVLERRGKAPPQYSYDDEELGPGD